MKKLKAKKDATCMACLACVNACAEAFYKVADPGKACLEIIEKKGEPKPTTVLQQYMFAYSLKVFCMAAYKLFCFLKFRHILLAFYNVLWYNKYYMKRSIYYVS